MSERCRFGVELPLNHADPFGTVPEEFFQARLMPQGTPIPRVPYGPEVIAKRVHELGVDFACYGVRYNDAAAVTVAAEWAASNGFGLMLNNPICQIHGPVTPGLSTWAFPPEWLREAAAKADLLGVIYDELIHHQIHPGVTGHTNPWNALADVADCSDPRTAYERVERGLAVLFDRTAPTGVRAFTEQVVPALFHAVAHCGGRPGCKILKEQISPISLTLCMSAARQYATEWMGTVDLWEGDSGPWYQIMARMSGHSPKEFGSALELMALLNPYATLVESADVLWITDSATAELTEFGEVFRRFRHDVLPRTSPAFDAATWRPTVAFVRCEDGCFERPDPVQFDEPAPIYPNPNWFLLGCRNLAVTPAASKWLRAWYHLSWGRCSGKTLHNYFNPLETAVARRNEVGGNEHDPLGCPSPEVRRDATRVETHMHSLFTPLNNVMVFDGYVDPRDLDGVALIICCGSYCRPETRAAVRADVEAGARCVCQDECCPEDLRSAAGERIGRGHWWTVSDFDQPEAIEQFLRFRGYHNQWILRSALGTLRIHCADAWGNEIGWELEPHSGRHP